MTADVRAFRIPEEPSQAARLFTLVDQSSEIQARLVALLEFERIPPAAIELWALEGRSHNVMKRHRLDPAAVGVLRELAGIARALADEADALVKQIEEDHGTHHRN